MKKQNKNSLSAKCHIQAFASAILPRLESILSPLFINNQYWTLAFHEAIGLYGYYMALKQEEVNEFIEFIKLHPDKFRKEIVESEEFRNGFVLFFQDYLKIRVKEKRKIAKEIFIGFSQSNDKEEFDLEKLDDALLKISISSLKILIFLKNEILPMKKEIVREELRAKKIDYSQKSEEWWFNIDWERESLSRFIQKWLFDNYSPNAQKVKNKHEIKDDKWDKEKEASKKIYDAVDELVQLGILKIRVASGGGFGGSAGAEYDFSKFGYQFIEYLDLHDEQN